MSEYSLTHSLTPFLERHLVLPLIEFNSSLQTYNENDLKAAKLDLLNKTHMVDFASETHAQLYPDASLQPFNDKRADVLVEMRKLKADFAPILAIVSREEVQTEVQESRDHNRLMQYLEQDHQFNPEMLEILFKWAKFLYECGDYSKCSDYMFFYRQLVPTTDKNYLSCLWGKLGSEILTHEWDGALEDLNRLKDVLDGGSLTSTPLQALQQRAWLIHQSLFVFFNHSKGRELIVEMFLYQAQYLNTIQTLCPHILRYLAAAIVLTKTRRPAALRDLVKVIQQENYTYSDPITQFLAALHVDFDFAAAQEKLKLCSKILANDFFLVACYDEFIDNARLMIFELFCRIHQCIRVDMLADKLDMPYEEAERWIVDLVRQAKLDAKIDSQLGHVIMGTQAVSPYQQLIDKTNNLSFRTQMISNNLEKKMQARTKQSSYR